MPNLTETNDSIFIWFVNLMISGEMESHNNSRQSIFHKSEHPSLISFSIVALLQSQVFFYNVSCHAKLSILVKQISLSRSFSLLLQALQW